MRPADDLAGLDDVVVHARVLAVGGRRGVLEIVDRLTPYVAETLATHALCGTGRALEVTLPVGASEQAVERVRWRFASLGRRGVALDVRCGPSAPAGGPRPRRRGEEAA